ncbi:cupin [Paucibacter sp. R3-3]|uniref:Cupin n=1 Tax=Roseateles agri TaxID=3098619 RepID=A0ABU5DRW7_9BURK|nr:cupin [Paucibacter sp. R3-3]MDY0749063.1 cupin [Paucibacter sp. R3-3]
MAQAHHKSGERFVVKPLGKGLGDARTTALIKAEQLELVRIVLHAGKGLPMHQVAGEITVLCLEGRIDFETSTTHLSLEAGDIVHLACNEPHALSAVEDASALLTICLPKL